VGYYYLDTTVYENGVHNIAWSVTDNEGETDGIGSRYFEVQNLGSASAQEKNIQKLFSFEVERSGRLKVNLKKVITGYKVQSEKWIYDKQYSRLIEKVESRSEAGSTYFEKTEETEEEGGQIIKIEIEELERVELRFKVKGGELLGWGAEKDKHLPIGSTLDKEKGIFYWQPGPGFLGKHVLHFAVTDGCYYSFPLRIEININPKNYQRKSKENE